MLLFVWWCACAAEPPRAVRPHYPHDRDDAVRLLQSQSSTSQAQVFIQDLQVLHMPSLRLPGANRQDQPGRRRSGTCAAAVQH